MHLSSIVAAAASCVGACAIASARINGGWKNLQTLALAYASATGFVVALAATPALAGRGSAALLGKRERDGSLPLWSLAVFAPFHLGLRAKLAFQRATGTESVWDEVMPLPPRREGGGRRGGGRKNNASSSPPPSRGRQRQNDESKDRLLPYYLGGWPHEVDALPPGVTAVVDVTAELPRIALRSPDSSSSPSPKSTSKSKSKKKNLPLPPPPARYLNLRTWDTHGPSPDQIERGVEWISEARTSGEGGGRRVLVHCAHGHGRSVTVLAAALLAERRRRRALLAEEEEQEHEAASSCPWTTDDDDDDEKDIDEVLAHIQQFRPRAKLNSRQRGALRAWLVRTREEKEREREGKKV